MIKFVLCLIPSFDNKNDDMKKNDKLPSFPIWEFSTPFPLKILINDHQYWLPLI